MEKSPYLLLPLSLTFVLKWEKERGVFSAEETTWWKPPSNCPKAAIPAGRSLINSILGADSWGHRAEPRESLRSSGCREQLPHPPGWAASCGAEGEVAATQKAGWRLPREGPGDRLCVIVKVGGFCFSSPFSGRAQKGRGGGVAAAASLCEPHAGSGRPYLLPRDLLGCQASHCWCLQGRWQAPHPAPCSQA